MGRHEELIQRVEEAQHLLAATKDPNPAPWYNSVARQLDFVMSVAKSGGGPSIAEVESMSMGLLAVREIEPDYPELANAIYEVMGIFRTLHP